VVAEVEDVAGVVRETVDDARGGLVARRRGFDTQHSF
jgi:hypothetical protein